MRLSVIAVGTRMPAWVYEACESYQKRITSPVDFVLREVPAARRSKNSVVGRLLAEEGERVLAAVPEGAELIILDERGKTLNTRALATEMQRWIDESRHICLVIGGPDGVADSIKQKSRFTLRLSDFTLAHPLARVVIMEQVYRAFSIIRNLPYHRD